MNTDTVRTDELTEGDVLVMRPGFADGTGYEEHLIHATVTRAPQGSFTVSTGERWCNLSIDGRPVDRPAAMRWERQQPADENQES
jgi:hypothetical protein